MPANNKRYRVSYTLYGFDVEGEAIQAADTLYYAAETAAFAAWHVSLVVTKMCKRRGWDNTRLVLTATEEKE